MTEPLTIPDGSRVRFRRLAPAGRGRYRCAGCGKPATHRLTIDLPVDPDADCFTALAQAEPIDAYTCAPCGRPVLDALTATEGGAA